MNIALVGYGKMGHAIERIALGRGHSITCTVDAGEEDRMDSPAFRQADVAIEFTRPEAATGNFRRIIAADVPLVSGTTGWTADMDEVKKMLREHDGVMFWTSNFSIGVNLFRRVNSLLARIMTGFPQYEPSMTEIHHIHKLDHPSGTAITLASDIIEANARIDAWTEDPAEAVRPEAMLISHRREGEVPGTHIVSWESPVDRITIGHEAFSRDGFALGAVLAAEWLHANPEARGLVGMDALLSDI